MTDKIPLKLVDLGSGAGELREFATTDTIPTANLNATTSATDTTSGRVWRTDDLVKTTSATDTTAGRVLKVGDFGLGAVSSTFVTDCNAIRISGTYAYDITNGAINGPAGITYGTLIDAAFSISGHQQIFLVYADSKMFVRSAYTTYEGWTPWVEVATSANSLGQGQTWQDMTGSRAFSTAYTNSTGRPIMLSVSSYATTGDFLTITINGVVAYKATSLANTALGTSLVVQAGASYVVSQGGTSPVIYNWSELR